MATYSFRYVRGQNGPHGSVIANNDEEASEAIRTFLAQKDGVLMPGTIVVTVPPRAMPDPEWTARAT